jgi:PAS domain S-box-containing protein
MNAPTRVLVVEDNPADFQLLQRQLARSGLAAECLCVAELGDLERALGEQRWDVVLSDYSVPQLGFDQTLALVTGQGPDLPLILVSGSVGEEKAVELLKLGVWDFVLKDNLGRLVPAIEHALREAAERYARRQAETALRESEARFRLLVEHLPAITYVAPLDRRGRPFYISPQVGQILGFSRDEYLATDDIWHRQLHPEDRERVLEQARACRQSGKPFACEYRMLARDGQTVWLRDEADSVRGEDGKPSVLQGLMLDIGEEKRAQLERETTVEFLRLVNSSSGTRELVQQATTFFQKVSGCDAVGVRLRQDDDYPYYEAHGFPKEFILLESRLCERDSTGQIRRDSDGYPIWECMCGNVIRGRFDPSQPFFTNHGSFWTNCTTELLATSSEEDRQSRTRNRCNGEGYESVALLPLHAGEEQLGLLQLNHRQRDRFAPEDIALWERLADHLSVALAKLQAEESLLESEERHRLLFETSRDAMVTASPPSWRFTQGNPAAIRMFRARDEADFTSRAPWDYSPEYQPDGTLSAPKAREMIEAALREGSHAFEWRHKRLDGEEFPAQVLLTRFELNGEALLQATVRDVTKEKEAEAALQASEERYRALLEGAAEGILVPDVATRRIRYANPAMCRMLGYTNEELLQLAIEDIHPEEKLDFVLTDFQEHTRGEAASSNAIPCLRKDGTIVYADITTSPIEFDGAACLVAFFDDVTEQLRLATEKDKLEAQMRQAQKLEAIGSLAGGVAHDFNNILTGIRGYVEFALEDAAGNPAAREDLEETLGLVERAADLTRQLLAFSRKQTLQPAILELNELIRDHLKMLGRLLGEDIDIRFLPSPELGHVEADPGQISQVLMNLVVNARDAMPNGGRLIIETANVHLPDSAEATIEGTNAGPHIRITVSDSGNGMDEETRGRIFEPFFTTKELGKGTGMGLAMVHGIVKQHGGDIRVYSEVGQGTVFRIYLPRVPGEEERPQTARPAVEGGSERILLVEDEAPVRRVVERWLEKWGYTVLSAANPAEAEELADEHPEHLDLLLTDVVMPGRNGLELYESLVVTRPDLRVIYMSGYTSEAIVHRGILKEGIQFIEKPIGSAILAAKLREVLDATRDEG